MRLRLSDLDGVLVFIAAPALFAGLLAQHAGAMELARACWVLGVAPSWLVLAWAVLRATWKRQPGADMLALAAMSFALLTGAELVAAVVSLMLASGRWLERLAQARAQRSMTELLRVTPKLAQRLQGGQWLAVDVAQVMPGDRLLVRHGEIVPVDGTLETGADLDESTLTGESVLRRREAGEAVSSGVLNSGAAFDMVAGATAERSTFAAIVRMVQAAREQRSPAQRMADRYALVFAVAAAVLAAAGWLWSADPQRALAVLVVATPCPLILAVPVAIASGLSRCARRGVMVKGGAALEQLAVANVLCFDKTGTLTSGQADLVDFTSAPGTLPTEVLTLAASLAQASSHVTSESLVKAGRARGLTLQPPDEVVETPGAGVRGRVGGHAVSIGSMEHVLGACAAPAWSEASLRRMGDSGAAAVFVGVDGALAGVLQLLDRIRLETPRALRLLRKLGIHHQVMLTGDRADVAAAVGSVLGVDAVHAALSPPEKLAEIGALRRHAAVIMVGDGVNDAPALAAADVGVAMGARGAAASSEAADVVLLVDRLDRLPEVIEIARRTRRIALQSVAIGMGLSLLAMVAAALGHLPPLAGAVLQEGIDLLAIVNALRALQAGAKTPIAAWTAAEIERLKAEHAALEPLMQNIRDLAGKLAALPGSVARVELTALRLALTQTLLPHERQDDTRLYPDMARLLGGDDPLAAMSGMHRAIFSMVDTLGNIIASLPEQGPDASTVQELQRLLYGLDAVLRLHCEQEDALFHVLGP